MTESTPLSRLVKACETIGTEPSPNKKALKSQLKSGLSNGIHRQASPRTNGHELNGKYENGVKNKKDHNLSRKSPKNSLASNPALNCEPSTSLMLPNGMPNGLYGNGFPNMMLRQFGMNPNAMGAPPTPFAAQQAMAMAAAQQASFGGMAPPNGFPPFNFMAQMAAMANGGMPTSSMPLAQTNSNVQRSNSMNSSTQPLPMSSPVANTTTNNNNNSTTTTQTSSKTPPANGTGTPKARADSQLPQFPSNMSETENVMALMAAAAQQQQLASLFAQYPFPMMNPMPLPPQQSPQIPPQPNSDANGMFSPNSNNNDNNSFQAIMMAAACGQLRSRCLYDVKGLPCNKSFENDADLLNHYKTHVVQLSSNSSTPNTTAKASSPLTTSTTTALPATNSGSGGKIKTSPKTSPISSSPKSQQMLNPAMGMYNWPTGQQMQAAQQMRFHPYNNMKPMNAQQAAALQQQHQQQQQQQMLYEMAAAMSAGANLLPFGGPHPHMVQNSEKQV